VLPAVDPGIGAVRFRKPASLWLALAAIPDTAWQQITYPTAVPDSETGDLIPEAEVVAGRYRPFFTDNPAPTLQSEREYRHHAVVEQVIADSKASALAHLPSGHFQANAAWLTLWAMTCNLLRATVVRPPPAIPGPPPPPSAPTWSRSRLGSPAPHGASHCTCHNWPRQEAWTPVRHRPPPTRTGLTASARPARQGLTGTEPCGKAGQTSEYRLSTPRRHSTIPPATLEYHFKTASVDQGLDCGRNLLCGTFLSGADVEHMYEMGPSGYYICP
jgi:hypothetical protein